MTAPPAAALSKVNSDEIAGLEAVERDAGCFFLASAFFAGLRFPVPDFEVPFLVVPRLPRL